MAAGAVLMAGCSAASATATDPPATAADVPAGQRGQVRRRRVARTVASARPAHYSIYLPPGYDQDTARRYPVVYLLHGASHDNTFFSQLGVQQSADRLLADGQIQPMILVMPDGGPTFKASATSRTFDEFFATELVPAVDSQWRTIPRREARAVGGISLGGLRALEIAAANPGLLSAAGGHSAALSSADADRLASRLIAAETALYLDVGKDDPCARGTRPSLPRFNRRGPTSRCWSHRASTPGRTGSSTCRTT